MEKQTDNNVRKGSIAAQIQLLQEAQNRVDPTGRARADLHRMRMLERTPPYKTSPETAEALGKLPSETRVDEEKFTAMLEESHRELTAAATTDEPPADAPGASLPCGEYAAVVSASEAAERFCKFAEDQKKVAERPPPQGCARRQKTQIIAGTLRHDRP